MVLTKHIFYYTKPQEKVIFKTLLFTNRNHKSHHSPKHTLIIHCYLEQKLKPEYQV